MTHCDCHVQDSVRKDKAYLEPSVIRSFKGQKNAVEVQGMRNSHVRTLDFLHLMQGPIYRGIGIMLGG